MYFLLAIPLADRLSKITNCLINKFSLLSCQPQIGSPALISSLPWYSTSSLLRRNPGFIYWLLLFLCLNPYNWSFPKGRLEFSFLLSKASSYHKILSPMSAKSQLCFHCFHFVLCYFCLNCGKFPVLNFFPCKYLSHTTRIIQS